MPALSSVADLVSALAASLQRWSATCETVESAVAARLLLVTRLQEQGERQVLSWAEDALSVPGLLAVLETVGVHVIVPQFPRLQGHVSLPKDIERVNVGLTGADAALADSGVLVLSSGPGRPALAYQLPRHHYVLLPASRIYADMSAWPTAAEQLGRGSACLLAGPSASFDIELERAVGVHGPRSLHVLVVQGI